MTTIYVAKEKIELHKNSMGWDEFEFEQIDKPYLEPSNAKANSSQNGCQTSNVIH